jgi:hypothetical protein
MFNLHEGVFCFHELAATDSGWRMTRDLYSGADYVGDSSTYGYLPRCSFQKAVKVGILREPEESVKACRVAFPSLPVPDRGFDEAKQLLSKWADMCYLYKEIFDLKVLRSIFKYCCPNAEFEHAKVGELLKMNVQRQDKHVFNPESFKNIFNG